MSEATEPPVLTGLDDGSILIRAHGEGQWFMPSDKLRKVLFDLDLATTRGEEIRRLRAENERLESVIRNSDAALSDEYIGLMRGHLAEVGIEATFADDVAMLAKREILRLREQLEEALELSRMRARDAIESDARGYKRACVWMNEDLLDSIGALAKERDALDEENARLCAEVERLAPPVRMPEMVELPGSGCTTSDAVAVAIGLAALAVAAALVVLAVALQ